MSRIIVVFLVSILLVGCSSQGETPESETRTWVFQNGTAIEFPQTWQIQPTGDLSERIFIQDNYGLLFMSRDARNHDTMEAMFLENNETAVEIEIEGDVRLLSVEITIESQPELFDGNTEIIQYVALVPNETVLTIFLAITPDLEERQAMLIEALNTVHALDDAYNVLAHV